MSPTTPRTTPVASASGSPIAPTASAIGSTFTLGTEMSTLRPSMLDRAVRGRAGADIGQLAQGVELQIRVPGHRASFPAQAETGTSTTASQSTIRAICPSERTAAPDRAAPSATSGGSGRVTSSCWPTSRETVSAKRSRAAAHDDRVLGVGRGVAAEALGGVDDRQHAVGEDEHAPAGDRAHGLVGHAHGALDAVERDRERAAVGLDDQRGHDRQRQRQADLGARALAELGGHDDLAAEPADRGAHRVHADAAAGDVAGDLGGREAGGEEQLDRRARCRSSRPARARSARARRPWPRRARGRCRGRRRRR